MTPLCHGHATMTVAVTDGVTEARSDGKHKNYCHKTLHTLRALNFFLTSKCRQTTETSGNSSLTDTKCI